MSRAAPVVKCSAVLLSVSEIISGRNDGGNRRETAAKECRRSLADTLSAAASSGYATRVESAVALSSARAEHAPEMPLAEHDHMIEALALHEADQSLSYLRLQRRASWRLTGSVPNAHRANPPAERSRRRRGRDRPERGKSCRSAPDRKLARLAEAHRFRRSATL